MVVNLAFVFTFCFGFQLVLVGVFGVKPLKPATKLLGKVWIPV